MFDFDTSTVQVISILILVLTLLVIAVIQRGRFTLRRIKAYDLMPDYAGLAIESNNPMHLSIGGTGIGGKSTLLAIAAAEMANYITEKAAVGDTPPILTVSEPSVIPLGQDALRRAYVKQGYASRYRATSVRWYPAGARSLAFAAAISAMIADDEVSSNVMAGSFGAELAVMIDAGRRREIPSIAMSDQLEGQAVAYALSDAPLIGEEVFAAPGYLSGDASHTTEAASIDLLRWLLVLVMLGGLIATIIGE